MDRRGNKSHKYSNQPHRASKDKWKRFSNPFISIHLKWKKIVYGKGSLIITTTAVIVVLHKVSNKSAWNCRKLLLRKKNGTTQQMSRKRKKNITVNSFNPLTTLLEHMNITSLCKHTSSYREQFSWEIYHHL